MGAAEPEGARGRGRGGGEALKSMDMTSSREGSELFDLGMGMLDVRDGLPAMMGEGNKVERWRNRREEELKVFKLRSEFGCFSQGAGVV